MPPLKNDVNKYRNNPILIYIIQQNSDINNLITIKKFESTSATVNPNSATIVNIDVSNSGYTAMGIVGCAIRETNNNYYNLMIVRSIVDNNKLTIYVKSAHTSAVTFVIEANILYLKNLT